MGLVLTVVLLAFRPIARAESPKAHAAVATENELATREGMAQLKAGGNAVDAAVAAALVAGVTSPTSSGIGGGGFAVVWLAAEQQARSLDFRETAPAGVDPAAFERRPLPDPERGQLIGVPGEVKGLFELQRRYGKRRWADLVTRAAHLATSGSAVGPYLAGMLASAPEVAKMDGSLAAAFFPGNRPRKAGEIVRRSKLGTTLRRIAAEGPDALYKGSIALDLVQSARGAKGTLSAADLEGYTPIERTPLHLSWDGYDVYTMPLPSAGGLMLGEALGMVSRSELEKLGFASGAYQHLLAEMMRGALADRVRFLGDPAFTRVDVAKLLSKSRLAERRRRIEPDKTHQLPQFGEEHGTHHLVTADASGNFVSLTTTVNRLFGAKLVGTESGVVLNDELDDFTPQKIVSAFGLKENPNRPRAGARPISSMTPTIVVKNGQVVLALGGSGGTTIATNVTQLLIARLTFGFSPERLLRERRFYLSNQLSGLLLEDGSPKELSDDLAKRGEVTSSMPFKTSGVQMIAVENGHLLAASDPRKHGFALAQ